MIEFITHIVPVIVTAVIITFIVLLINRLDRKGHGEYHITCEHKFFLFSYGRMNDAIEKLNELGKDGWEVASFAGGDDFQTLLILKRETLHTSKVKE
ncbi:MAG: hypothetical protein HDR86_03535 [Bacteroides sp.]|nr:hypothetical protein [Bacteroides sp.]